MAFLCTSGAAGADKLLADLQRLSGKRALATLALPQQVIDQGQFDGAVEQFVRRFNGHRGERVADARLTA